MKTVWKCLKCGECCKKLVGRRFGMALLPEEHRLLSLFARRHGISFEAAPLVPGVIGARLYQFTQEKCPFLGADNYCRAYQIRPLTCRMFPLHPNGVMDCTILTQQKLFHIPVDFPKELKSAATMYALLIQPLIQEAHLVYSLNHGWTTKSRFPELRTKVT